jgi:transcription initiation factor TFIIE subunit alpha
MAKRRKKIVKKQRAKRTKKTKRAKPGRGAEERPSFLQNPVLVDVLHQISGEAGLAVLKALEGKELTDEDLAKRTGLQVNLVRRVLYDLHENQVVTYRRERDEESGWYIYYWKFNPERAMDFIRQNRLELLRKLEEKLERERETPYFSCENNCQKYPYGEALENDFKCPTCGSMLKPYDNSKYIAALEHKVRQLREQLRGG